MEIIWRLNTVSPPRSPCAARKAAAGNEAPAAEWRRANCAASVHVILSLLNELMP